MVTKRGKIPDKLIEAEETLIPTFEIIYPYPLIHVHSGEITNVIGQSKKGMIFARKIRKTKNGKLDKRFKTTEWDKV